MLTTNRRYDSNLLAILNMLGIASILGFLYCLTVLLHGSFNMEPSSIVLYMLWFVISFISVSLMKQGDHWGAYALGIATLAITIYDLVNGFATIGGAVLGITVMLIIIGFIRTSPQAQSTMDTRLTN